jgi:hypothetical protein
MIPAFLRGDFAAAARARRQESNHVEASLGPKLGDGADRASGDPQWSGLVRRHACVGDRLGAAIDDVG